QCRWTKGRGSGMDTPLPGNCENQRTPSGMSHTVAAISKSTKTLPPDFNKTSAFSNLPAELILRDCLHTAPRERFDRCRSRSLSCAEYSDSACPCKSTARRGSSRFSSHNGIDEMIRIG